MSAIPDRVPRRHVRGCKIVRDILVIAGICWSLAAAPLPAGDWPQILGPQRNGIAADDERLAEAWPAGGPRLVWSRPVGSGYAGVAVVGTRIVLFHRVADEEIVTALSASDGHPLWQDGHPSDFTPGVGSEGGPLCVPTVQDGKVVTFGAQGVLSCHDLQTGQALWAHQTHREYGAAEGYFGAGSSPLVEAGRVIVNVGGARSGAGIVAFDLATGRELWKQTAEQASYAAPIAGTVNGQRHVIVVTRLKCVSLDPTTGAVRFEFPFGQRGPTVNAATPLLLHDKLFLTASYGIGAVYAGVRSDAAAPLYSGDEILSSQYTTCVEHEGLLYGIDGRDDVPPARLVCFDPASRAVRWSEPDFGYSTLLKADGKLLIAQTDGHLILARLTSRKFEPLASAQVFRGTLRALPALSNGRIYVRDDSTLKCLDVGRAPLPSMSRPAVASTHPPEPHGIGRESKWVSAAQRAPAARQVKTAAQQRARGNPVRHLLPADSGTHRKSDSPGSVGS